MLTRLTQDVSNLVVTSLILDPSDPTFQRETSKNRSQAVMKLLKARECLELLAATPANRRLTQKAASLLIKAYLGASLPLEALAVYERHLKPPLDQPEANSFRLNPYRLDLILGLLAVDEFKGASQLLGELTSPDFPSDLAVVVGLIYFSFILFGLFTAQIPGPQVYAKLIALTKDPKALKGPMALKIEDPPPGEEAARSLGSLTKEDRAFQPLTKAAKTLDFLYPLVVGHLDQTRPLTLDEQSFHLTNLAHLGAFLMVFYYAERREYGRLLELYDSFKTAPLSEADPTLKAAMILEGLSRFDPLGRRSIAEEFLAHLWALPNGPEVNLIKAQGLVALARLYHDDPSLAKALKLKGSLEGLPYDPNLTGHRLRLLGLLAAYSQAHGYLTKAQSFRDEAYELYQKEAPIDGPKGLREDPKDQDFERNQKDNAEIMARILLTSLSAPPVMGQASQALATFKNIFNLPNNPPLNRIKAQAALLILARPDLTDQADLAVQIFQRLSQIRDAGPIAGQLAQAVATLLRSLAQAKRYDQLELYLRSLETYAETDDYLALVRAASYVELVAGRLENGEETSALALAAKIEALGSAPRLLAEKGRLRLVFIRYYGAKGLKSKALETFLNLKNLSQEPALSPFKAAALVTLASMEAILGDINGALAFRRDLAELAETSLDLESQEAQKMTANVGLMVFLVAVNQNRLDLAREFLTQIFHDLNLGANPQDALTAGLILARRLTSELNLAPGLPTSVTCALNIDLTGQDQLKEVLALGDRLALLGDPGLVAQAQINLMALKNLVAKGRLAQAIPYLKAIDQELKVSRPLYAEGLYTLATAYAQGDLYFPKFQLAKPARRDRAVKKVKDIEPLEESSGQGFFERLLALPLDNGVSLWRYKAARKLIAILMAQGHSLAAFKIYQTFPEPCANEAYETATLRLNAAFDLINGLINLDPEAALDLVSSLIRPENQGFFGTLRRQELESLAAKAVTLGNPDLAAKIQKFLAT
jgi:hypothetical protein